MKILISNYNYPGLVKGLEDLGHEVYHSDRLNWWSWCWGSDDLSPGAPLDYHNYLINECAKNKIDAVIIGKGFDSNKAEPSTKPPFWHILPDTVDMLKAKNIKVIWLSFDQPDDFGFSIAAKAVTKVDAIGTCCVITRDYYKRFTPAPVFEFWPAWDQVLRTAPDFYAPKLHKFLIVGSPYLSPNDEFGIPRKDIALAALDLGIKPSIFGPDGWIKNEHGGDKRLEPYYYGFAHWNDLHDIYGTSEIVYNSFLRRGFRYVNDRIFIAGGAGAFLLMEEQLGLEQEFIEGTHTAYHEYRNLDDFKKKLGFWATNKSVRDEIALDLQKLIHNKHTYAHRAQILHDILTDLMSKKQTKQCCRGAR